MARLRVSAQPRCIRTTSRRKSCSTPSHTKVTERRLHGFEEADPVTESPADRLRAVIGEFARTHAQYHARARVVEYELAALAPDHYRVIVGLRRELTRHVRRIVEAGSADGSFVVPDSEGVTLAIISLCVDVCRWFPAGRYTDPDKVAKLYSELAVRLVGADERVGTD